MQMVSCSRRTAISEDNSPMPHAVSSRYSPTKATGSFHLCAAFGCRPGDRTNEPIGVQYCFDANGNGKRTITKQQSKDRCVGSVRAKFDSSGRLRIDSDGAVCGKGGGFVPETVECSSSGGKADCSGAARGDKQRKWKAQFRRS